MTTALEVIQNCEKSGVKVSVRGANLRIDAPKGLPDSIKESLRQHKAEIIRALVENPKPPSLTKHISRLIESGASFDVGPNSFQVFGASDRENIFLRDNNAAVLCTLHQSALMKYLSLSDLQMFKDEVRERAAILSDGETLELPFEVIAEVAREWFTDLLEEITKK